MKVRIGRDELLTGLQRVQGVVEKRNTMPILSNILIEAKQEGAEIVATDLEIGMRGLYKATVHKAGGITVSARTTGRQSRPAKASSRSSDSPAAIIRRCPPLSAKA